MALKYKTNDQEIQIWGQRQKFLGCQWCEVIIWIIIWIDLNAPKFHSKAKENLKQYFQLQTGVKKGI